MPLLLELPAADGSDFVYIWMADGWLYAQAISRIMPRLRIRSPHCGLGHRPYRNRDEAKAGAFDCIERSCNGKRQALDDPFSKPIFRAGRTPLSRCHPNRVQANAPTNMQQFRLPASSRALILKHQSMSGGFDTYIISAVRDAASDRRATQLPSAPRNHNGTCVHDYIYVTALTEAHTFALAPRNLSLALRISITV